jgi:WD repeat-containing protein 68
MPLFGGHSRSASSSAPQQNAQGAASGILQAAQALGSIGAPAGNLRSAAQGTTSAGTDSLYSSNTSLHGANNTDSVGSGPPRSANQSLSNNSQQFETARRPPNYRGQSDELHLGAPTLPSNRGAASPRDPQVGGAPRIKVEQSTPETSQYQSSNNIPGALQSAQSRPPAYQSHTSPTVPTMQNSGIAGDPFQTPLRSAGPVHSHGYSRSSPATHYDGQSYQPYTTTPGGSATTPNSSLKYTPVQQRNVSNTPLGLADIRPRADSNLPDVAGANPYSFDGQNTVPTNSNYLAPWAVYAFDWCKWPAHNSDAGKIAVGSYLEDGHNFIQILESQIRPTSPDSYTPGAPKYGLEFNKIAEATHSYPVTRLLWEPPSSAKQSTDLLATSGDHLRLWSLPADTQHGSHSNSITRSANQGAPTTTKLTPLALLSNSKTPEHTAPLTSLDWNTVSPSLIITSSIDTTCTIWDIPTLTAKTQLIAHDKEVFDVRFCANSVDVFVSCGADGSVRMFDLRSLEHSTIIYEPTAKDDKGQYFSGMPQEFQSLTWSSTRLWTYLAYFGTANNDLCPPVTPSRCFAARYPPSCDVLSGQ